MLNAPTLEQLHALKLAAMATAWTEQQPQADMTALAFDERFALLVEAEWRARENQRLARALHEAKLKLSHACLEAIDYPARRELDKAVIRQLAACRWVEEHQAYFPQIARAFRVNFRRGGRRRVSGRPFPPR